MSSKNNLKAFYELLGRVRMFHIATGRAGDLEKLRDKAIEEVVTIYEELQSLKMIQSTQLLVPPVGCRHYKECPEASVCVIPCVPNCYEPESSR